MSGMSHADVVASLVTRIGGGRDALLPLLLALQDRHGYLPEAALLAIVEQTECTAAGLKGAATFYRGFRLLPSGRHRVEVCTGTACHAQGAPAITDALRHHLRLLPGEDTDVERVFTLREAACFGCCTMAPVVAVDGRFHGSVAPDDIASMVDGADAAGGLPGSDNVPERRAGASEVRVGLGSCCTAKGAGELLDALVRGAQRLALPVTVRAVGCVGMCSRTPFVEIVPASGEGTHYENVRPEAADALLARHFQGPGSWRRLVQGVDRSLGRWADPDGAPAPTGLPVSTSPATRFFAGQRPIATEHHGVLSPVDLSDYQARGGLVGWGRCRDGLAPDEVIEALESSGLRGRGGAGYPSATKWRAVRAAGLAAETRPVVVVNGDEGDPGAFMDRMLLESYPLRVLEGALIAAYAVGADRVLVHVRGEYPLAVARCEAALEALRAAGLLAWGSEGEALDVRIVRGGGAFVCGEESALLSALAGARPTPRLRPPYPSERGLDGRPTLVNNVETLAMVPWILREGPAAFAALGTTTASGTKVLALAGKVRHGGLIEVPMGTSLRVVVEDLGGGALEGRTIKAVQVGGPSGGCIPAETLDTPIDYEALRTVGGTMGSGGIVVLDETVCMVDMARYFVAFSHDQSCGKCSVGRVGTLRLLEGLTALCEGRARPDELERLDVLAETLREGALCGLCRSAPNPYLSTRRYFPDEYDEHLAGRCTTTSCRDLVRYDIRDECTGCTICSQHCPTGAIEARPHRRHEVTQEACIRCRTCARICPFEAVEVTRG